MPRPVAGGVADGMDPVQSAIGDHAQNHGVLRINVAAEGSGQDDAVNARRAVTGHQQLDAGIQCRLG